MEDDQDDWKAMDNYDNFYFNNKEPTKRRIRIKEEGVHYDPFHRKSDSQTSGTLKQSRPVSKPFQQSSSSRD